MIKRLIVNADDYGLSEGVCLGILKANKVLKKQKGKIYIFFVYFP